MTFTSFLGDLFDEGKWCPPAEFESYVARFRSLFRVDTSKTRVHVMAGNHDIGFHYAVNPYLDSRFREAFNTKAVQLSVLENTIPIVRINSMAFEGDSCFLCKEAKKNLETVKNKLQVNLTSFYSATDFQTAAKLNVHFIITRFFDQILSSVTC